jgi:hypothetical protein
MDLSKSGLDHDEVHCQSTKQSERNLIWKDTRQDGLVPFHAYTLGEAEKDGKDLKKVDFTFDDSLVLTNMCKPDKKPKVYKEARCRRNGHLMVLARLNRHWNCNGECGRSNWRDHPNVDYYTCEQCDLDYCPNCFHLVEKTIVIKKT